MNQNLFRAPKRLGPALVLCLYVSPIADLLNSQKSIFGLGYNLISLGITGRQHVYDVGVYFVL